MKILRIILLILAIISLVAGSIGLIKYAKDYAILSEYGQGYVIGKVVLLISSLVLFYISKRINKRTNTSTRNY